MQKLGFFLVRSMRAPRICLLQYGVRLMCEALLESPPLRQCVMCAWEHAQHCQMLSDIHVLRAVQISDPQSM